MVKIISFFNHKGGVGKTTTAYNLGYGLARLGKKVLLIDADSQMNLTAYVYGLSTNAHYGDKQTSKWKELNQKYTSLSCFIENLINNQALDYKLYNYKNHHTKDEEIATGDIDLLRGDLDLNGLEVNVLTLIKNNNPLTRQNIVYIALGLRKLYEKYDFVLIDQSPSSASIINGILTLTSSYTIVPSMPTFFSLQAVNNLQDIWISWLDTLGTFAQTSNKDGFIFNSKFLGIIVQQAKKYANKDASHTEEWKQLVNSGLNSFLNHPICSKYCITKEQFDEYFHEEKSKPFIIGTYYNFTQLRSIAEKKGIPIIRLKENDLPNEDSKNSKKQTYKNLYNHIIELNQYICNCLIGLQDN